MAKIRTHASTGKIRSSAPGSRRRGGTGMKAKARPSVQKSSYSTRNGR